MTRFDVYRPQGTETPDGAFAGVARGTTLRLDGCDGFYDQYFEALGPRGDAIRFVVVSVGDEELASADAMAAASLVDAIVVENFFTAARVSVTSIRPFREWIETSDVERRMTDVAVDRRPPDDVVEDVVAAAMKSSVRHVLWRPTATPSTRTGSELVAVYACAVDGSCRVAFIRDYADTSEVVRATFAT